MGIRFRNEIRNQNNAEKHGEGVMNYDYSIHTIDTDIAIYTSHYALAPALERKMLDRKLDELRARKAELMGQKMEITVPEAENVDA
jgi:hypothetical protein